jgi:hypothetical protein
MIFWLILYYYIIFEILLLIQISWFVGVIAYIRNKNIMKECAKCEYKED